MRPLLILALVVLSGSAAHRGDFYARIGNRCLYSTVADRTFPTISPSVCQFYWWKEIGK